MTADGRGMRAMTVLRGVLLVLGAVALIKLVHGVGLPVLAQLFRDAGPYLPAVLALEVLWIFGSDMAAIRGLSGASRSVMPTRAVLDATMACYALSILAPAGRATGEVVRATTLARFVGAGRAAITGAHVHASSLLGNAIMCGIVGVAVILRVGTGAVLTKVVLANLVLVGLAASAIVAVARSPRFAAWVRRLRSRFARRRASSSATAAGSQPGTPSSTSSGVASDATSIRASEPPPSVAVVTPPPTRALAMAIGAFVAGRCVQCVQYAVVLLAVSGSTGAAKAMVAQSIHLVAANLGDLVPGQIGVTEGSYVYFGDALGFGATPARALAVPLVIRACQLTAALACLVGGTLTRRDAVPRASSPPTVTPPISRD